jgi:long-subunit fatty acid transport protein
MGICLLLPPAAGAHIFDLFGAGSRATALGSAGVALGADLASLYYNPAGIADIEDFQFSLSYLYADPTLEVDGKDTDVDSYSGVVIATAVPGRIANIKFSGGALFYVPDKRLARYLLMPKERPRYVLYANDAQRMVVLMPFAVQVTSWLSVGAGCSMLIEMSGKEELFVSEVVAGEPVVPSRGRHSEDFTPTFSPYGGILLKLAKQLTVGISYADKSEFTLDITPVVFLPDIYVYSWMPVPLIRATRIDARGAEASHFTPAQLNAGLTVRPVPRLLATASLTWARWSEYEEYTPRVTLKLSGVPGNLGDWIQVFEYPIPAPNFHDILIPAAGVEYRALESAHVDLDLRLGYYYRPSPVPDQTGLTNFMDGDIHAPSCGVGVTFKDLFRIVKKPLSLDAHFQYQIMTSRKIVKLNPADAVGDYETGGNILNVGGTLTARF